MNPNCMKHYKTIGPAKKPTTFKCISTSTFNFQLSMLVPYAPVCSSAAARSSCLFTDIADTKNQKQISRTRKEHHDRGIENSLTKSHAYLRDGVCETKITSSFSSLEIITVLR